MIQIENIIDQFKKECIKLEQYIKIIDNYLDKAPKGSLICKRVKEKVYYYHQIYEIIDDSIDEKYPSQKYIKKKNIKLARALAQKSYYILLKPIVENQLRTMRRFINSYNIKNEKELYDTLSNERKELVEVLDSQIDDLINEWNNEAYQSNDYFFENKVYDTNQGEKVRSKSEMIIANMLYEYKEDILYKYERPLSLNIGGMVRPIYPDFTILNKHTGKITYLEHAGCMDNPEYSDGFVNKINTYILNGIMPGDELVTTYETSEHPFDVKCVRSVIENMIYKK